MEDFNGMKPFTRVETWATPAYGLPQVNMNFYHGDVRTLAVRAGYYTEGKIESLEAPDVWINADAQEEHIRQHQSIDEVIALYEPSLSQEMIEQLRLMLPYLRDWAKPHPSWVIKDPWGKSEPKPPEGSRFPQWIRDTLGAIGGKPQDSIQL